MKKHEDLLQEVCALLRVSMDLLESPHEFDDEGQHGLAMILLDAYARVKLVIGTETADAVDLA